MLARWCNRLEHAALPADYALLDSAGLVSGHPWEFLAEIALADPGSVAYYRYLYGLAGLVDPENVLEIGTAFGLGSAALLQGAPRLRKLISLDLGVFTREYEIVDEAKGAGWPVLASYKDRELTADGRNIDFARRHLGALAARLGLPAELRLFQVNTQPVGSDNFDALVRVPRWFEDRALVEELERTPIDLLFIDGKHTGDGLYNDFKSFFGYVRPGGIVVCDDIHDSSYSYDWAGQTHASFERACREFASEIEDVHVWAFPQLPDWYDQEPIRRPWGLVRKRGARPAGTVKPADGRVVLYALDVPRDQLVAQIRFLLRNPGLVGFLESLGLPDGRIRDWTAFLRDHEPLFDALDENGLGDRAASDLRFLARNPELVAFLESLGLPDGRIREWTAFLRDHESLFQALEMDGLADRAASDLQFLYENETLFGRLNALGTTEAATRLLGALTATEAMARFVELAANHPEAAAYLATRPRIMVDLAQFIREAQARPLPNIRIAARLFPRWLAGRYRNEPRP